MGSVGIVLGYGCDKKRVTDYYREAASAFHFIYKPKAVISCGGFTDPVHFRGQSEAALGKEIMRLNLPRTPIFQEDRSWTTIENLLFADALLRALTSKDEGFEFDEIVIICDNIREFKVKVMARIILGTMFQSKITVHGINLPRTRKEKISQWLIKTPLEIIDCLLHLPGQFMTAKRFAQWQASGHCD